MNVSFAGRGGIISSPKRGTRIQTYNKQGKPNRVELLVFRMKHKPGGICLTHPPPTAMLHLLLPPACVSSQPLSNEILLLSVQIYFGRHPRFEETRNRAKCAR